MREKLKGLLIILIIAIVCVLLCFGKVYLDEKQQSDSVVNNATQNNASSNQSKVDDNKQEDNKEKEDETKKEAEENKTEEETNSTNEEKAIELAKKEYGVTDGGIYYRIDQIQSNTQYIVSVRNKDTSVLAWYIVDVSEGTVKDY